MATLEIEQAFRKLLVDNGGCSTRVFASAAPQKPVSPYIVFYRIASNHHTHMGGDSGLLMGSFRTNIYSDTFTECRQKADLLYAALHGYSGTVTIGSDSLVIRFISLVNDHDEYEEPQAGEQFGAYRSIQEYEVWIQE